MPCLCHGTDFDAAVEAHKLVVFRQIQKHKTIPGMSAYDDLLSDGLMHLWMALRDFNPKNGYNLDAFLSQRIAQRLIDGIRSRTHFTHRMKQRGQTPVEEIPFSHHHAAVHVVDPTYQAEVNVMGDSWLTSLAEIHPRLPRAVELLGLKFDIYEVERRVRIRADLLAELLVQIPGMETYELPSRPKMLNVFCKQGHQLTMRTCVIRADAARVCLTCRRIKKSAKAVEIPAPPPMVEIRVLPRRKLKRLRRKPSNAA